MKSSNPCPCGLGQPYGQCCGRFHTGEAFAGTAEALMRSRYSAFVVLDEAYLLRTWHSSRRPHRLSLDPDLRWTGLEVIASTGGGVLEPIGMVEFRASYLPPDGGSTPQVQYGYSRFVREEGHWTYLDEVDAVEVH